MSEAIHRRIVSAINDAASAVGAGLSDLRREYEAQVKSYEQEVGRLTAKVRELSIPADSREALIADCRRQIQMLTEAVTITEGRRVEAERALEVCGKAKAALQDDLAAQKAATLRVTNLASELQAKVMELEAQLASVGGPPPAPVVEAVLPEGSSVPGGITLLRERIGRVLTEGETARLTLPAGTLGPIAILDAEHEFWARGTLELAAQPGGAVVEAAPMSSVAIAVVSGIPTGGTCALVLRDIAVAGAVRLEVNGGAALRMVGTSKIKSTPRDANPTPI